MNVTTTKRFTLKEYHRLADLGFFNEDDRIELVRGEIIQMAAKGTAHTTCSRNLLKELARLVAGKAELQCQDPITLPSNSEPEPDFAILRQRADNYLSAHPHPADILLVAEAGITNYWIFNLVDNHLEAYSEPYQELRGNFGYSVKRIALPNQTINLPYYLDLSKIFPINTTDS